MNVVVSIWDFHVHKIEITFQNSWFVSFIFNETLPACTYFFETSGP